MMLFLGVAWVMVLCCTGAVVPETKELRLAHATNDLAFDLLKSLKNEKNVFMSPFSISTALALVYFGADGTTARAMRNVLKYDKYELTPADVNQGFLSLLSRVKSNTEDYQLSSYNNVLVQQNFHILESYKRALEQYYSANTEDVDFVRQGEQVKLKINADVEQATKGKIKDFLDQPPSADTKLFLLNAVYFLGNWEKPFNPDSTHESSFYNNGVQEKTVQMMTRDGYYQYSRNNELKSTVVVLPYKGDNSAELIVVLPDSKTGLEELEQTITQDSLNKILEPRHTSRAILYIPKFSLSYSKDLVQPLARLGLGELFGSNANLSRIAGPGSGLEVSSVVHKAVVDVNERGSEAAAATGIEIVPVSLPPIISIDHPFLFFIRDTQNGMILFSGKVNEL